MDEMFEKIKEVVNRFEGKTNTEETRNEAIQEIRKVIPFYNKPKRYDYKVTTTQGE